MGPVERGSARIRHQSQAGSFADLGERCGRLFPDVVATDELVRVFGGQFEVEVVEAVVLEQVQNELQGGGQLVAHLLTGAVDVSVVLGHAAHAGQAVDDAGLLVAVDRAEFEEPQRHSRYERPRARKIRLCIGQFIGLR